MKRPEGSPSATSSCSISLPVKSVKTRAGLETMPCVIDEESASGLPIANTVSPTRSAVGVAELGVREGLAFAARELEHREVGERVVGDDGGAHHPPVGERAVDAGGVAGDVEVGEHVPLRRDDDAAAGPRVALGAALG